MYGTVTVSTCLCLFVFAFVTVFEFVFVRGDTDPNRKQRKEFRILGGKLLERGDPDSKNAQNLKIGITRR